MPDTLTLKDCENPDDERTLHVHDGPDGMIALVQTEAEDDDPVDNPILVSRDDARRLRDWLTAWLDA